MFKSAGQSSVDCPALLFSVYFHLVFIPINLFSPCVPSPMSILICPVTCYSLASRSFWTYLLFFCALCPFSPARFRISLWLPENFGLFSCFSRLYVHFLLPGSVLLSGFMFFLDFFPVFLGFIYIWKSIEVSRLRRVRKAPDFEEFGGLRTSKSSEVSRLRCVQNPPDCENPR